ncbi:MAG: hypothetical protein Tsb0034_22770 [Ekhidna sp.]
MKRAFKWIAGFVSIGILICYTFYVHIKIETQNEHIDALRDQALNAQTEAAQAQQVAEEAAAEAQRQYQRAAEALEECQNK